MEWIIKILTINLIKAKEMPPSLYVFQEKPIYFETEGNIKLKYETGFKNLGGLNTEIM